LIYAFESKHNAIFLIPPDSVEHVYQEVGEIKPEYEKVVYVGSLIFWSAPIKTFFNNTTVKSCRIKCL